MKARNISACGAETRLDQQQCSDMLVVGVLRMCISVLSEVHRIVDVNDKVVHSELTIRPPQELKATALRVKRVCAQYCMKKKKQGHRES
jgi:hypothetical protein